MAITSKKTLNGFMAIIFFVLLISLQASAQNEVAIGSSTTKSNAILWLNGNGSQGLILPVVTNKSAVSNPDKGMVVFDDSDDKVYYHSGANWIEVGGGGGATSNPSLLLEGNQLQLKDGTTVKSTVNLAAGTQSNGAFLVFTGGSWQYATLSGDVTGANGALQVNGVKGKTIPTLPTTTQALVYDGTAWKFQALTAGTDSQTLTFTSPNLSISNGNSVNLSTLDKDAQTLTLTGNSLSISGGNAVTLPAGTLTSVTAGTGLTGGTITNTGTINVDVGTTANKIVQLDATGKLPTVDGSQLTNLAGDISAVTAGTGLTGGATTGAATLNVDVGTTANKIVQLDGTGKLPAVDGSQLTNLTGDISAVTAGTGLTGGATTGAATLNVDVGTTANKIVQLDATGKLPAVDGSQLTNLASATIADGSITGGSAGAGVKIAANTITDANILSLNAGKITSGTLPLAQVPNLDASKITTGTFTTAQIPNLDASKITSGVLPTTQGGTGISFSSGSIGNGQLLIGNSGSFAKANLSSGTGINITNGTGTIAIATTGDFGSQNLTTSGTLNAGATTLSALTINGAVWPANASGVLTNNGSGTLTWTPTGGTGTVTSVGLAMPSIFTVTNSPITTSGTLTTTLASQTAATVFAAPSGSAGVPTFRGLLSSDIPNLDASKITTGNLAIANGGTGSTTPAGALTNLGALSSTASAGGDLTGTFSNLQLVSNSIINTDISPTAAILGTKIDPSFGGLNVSTTGTLTAGATTLNSLVVPGTTSFNSRVYTWPNTVAAANTYLRNDGSGNLSWTTVAATTDLTAQNGILQGNGTAITGLAATTGLQYLRRNSGNTAFEFATLSSSDIPNLDAAKITSGILPVSVGGTGRSTWNGLLLGSGSTISDISTGAAGQVLKVVGTSPSWGLITDANIDPAAAINGSKVIPNFGTQALTSGNSTTFGTLSYTWPGTAGAANSVLTNDGAGALSWAAGGWGLAGNALAGGEVLGSTNGNPLSFITNNVERLRIMPSGNVGIGTTSPNAPLQFSNGVGRKIVLFEQANNDNQFIGLAVGGFGTFESQIPVNSNSFVWKAATSSTTSNELMRITGLGDVGIGTTAPISKLDVAGDLRLAQITAPSTTTDKLYNVGGSLFWNGTNISSGGSGWGLTGNSSTVDGTNFIGTTDNIPFTIRVNNQQAMRISFTNATSAPNILAGYAGNTITNGVVGSAILSGGYDVQINQVTDNYSVIGGGSLNRAGNNDGDLGNAGAATVSGGNLNKASSSFATVGGGYNNEASGNSAVVAGGRNAIASGEAAGVLSGEVNIASGFRSAVVGGNASTASGSNSFVGGGEFNGATGSFSAVSGGLSNLASGQMTSIPGGQGLFARSFGETAVGIFNIDYTPASSAAFNASDRLFVIGNGTSTSSRSNALTVLKNGNVGIGTATPATKLQVENTTLTEGIRVYTSRSGTGQNRGIIAEASGSTSQNVAVYGSAKIESSDGIGLYGESIGNGSSNAYGVVGRTNNFTITTGNAYAIYGSSTASANKNWAGYFAEGDVHITNALSLGATPGNFGIAGQVLTSAGAGLPPTWGPSGSGSGWNLTGNAGTNPATNFIGTTDAQPLRFSTGVGGVERMRIDAAGKIGIGVVAPTAGFDMLSNDGMAVKGTYGSGVIPSTGAGTRMMFYPRKAAFRVGRTFNDTGSESANWDDANIGDDSFAAGQNTIASGTRSFAVGKRAVASGSASVAMGDGTLASRFGSVAMGFVSEATGQEAFAVGLYTQAESRASVAIGHYNVGGGDPLAFNVTDPLFEIGNGTGVGVLRSNALTVLRNGKTSIGGINPQVMLEVKGTDAILLPVGTTAQRPSSSVAGYFRYNSSNSVVEFNNGSSWQSLGGGSGWSLTGNTGTVDGTSFIGTTDFVALNFRVGGLPSGRIDPINTQANTFLGYSSGSSNTGTLSTGLGYQTLQANTGSNNTAIGSYSMITNTSGFANTGVGGGAMRFNTTGAVNTAIGVNTLYQNTTGNNNTAVGGNALNQNTTGSENTAVGTQAMQLNLTGIGNTATGFYALINTTGSNNVAYGLRAGEINTSGSDNTFIGYYANASANNLINATAIGSGTTVDASNKVRIGNASVTVIQGQVGFTAASDRRLKTDIQDIGLGIDFIKKLRPVTYLMKAGDSRQNWGFIAQDIEALVGTDKAVLTIGQDSLRSLGLRYTDFIAPMVNAMQEQQKMIEDQQKMIDSLQARDAHSKKQIASLEASLQNMQSTDSEMQKLKAEIETIKKALGLAVEASLPAKKEEKKNEQ